MEVEKVVRDSRERLVEIVEDKRKRLQKQLGRYSPEQRLREKLIHITYVECVNNYLRILFEKHSIPYEPIKSEIIIE